MSSDAATNYCHFANIYRAVNFKYCARLSAVEGRSIVPADGVDIQRVAQAGFANVAYCEAKDCRHSSFAKIIEHLCDKDRLYYFDTMKDTDLVGDVSKRFRIGPLRYNSVSKTGSIQLQLKKSLVNPFIPASRAEEWEPGYTGVRTHQGNLDREQKLPISVTSDDIVNDLTKLTLEKPWALLLPSQVNFIIIRGINSETSLTYVLAEGVPEDFRKKFGPLVDRFYIFHLLRKESVYIYRPDKTRPWQAPCIPLANVGDWSLSPSAAPGQRTRLPDSPLQRPSAGPSSHGAGLQGGNHAVVSSPSGHPTTQIMTHLVPVATGKLRAVYDTAHQDLPRGMSRPAEQLCDHEPVPLKIVNDYMRFLAEDKHQQAGSWFLRALDCSAPLAEITVLRTLLETAHRPGTFMPDRIFLPCWTAEHTSLLVFKPTARPKALIEVWDPVPTDQRFTNLENNAIRLLRQHIVDVTVEIEFTHVNKLPFSVEKRESGIIALMVAKRLSRHTSARAAEEKAVMTDLLELEKSQSWQWEAHHIEDMRAMIIYELFEARRLVDPPQHLQPGQMVRGPFQ